MERQLVIDGFIVHPLDGTSASHGMLPGSPLKLRSVADSRRGRSSHDFAVSEIRAIHGNFTLGNERSGSEPGRI
jgi:hypothetical protein